MLVFNYFVLANSSKFSNAQPFIMISSNLWQPEKLPPILVNFLILLMTIFLNIGNLDSLLNYYKSSNRLLLRSMVCIGRSLSPGIFLILLYFKSNILNLGVFHLLTVSRFYKQFLAALKIYKFSNSSMGNYIILLAFNEIIFKFFKFDFYRPDTFVSWF